MKKILATQKEKRNGVVAREERGLIVAVALG
jgi:hypothetical protein